MESKILSTKKHKKEIILKKVTEILKENGIVILPTDTVYGLMTSIFNHIGQKQIYKLKK